MLSPNVNEPLAFDFACGANDCGFISKRWPTVELATSRGIEHDLEHASSTPMRDHHDFEAVRGFDTKDRVMRRKAALAVDLVAAQFRVDTAAQTLGISPGVLNSTTPITVIDTTLANAAVASVVTPVVAAPATTPPVVIQGTVV
jgi:hypothetical protein